MTNSAFRAHQSREQLRLLARLFIGALVVALPAAMIVANTGAP
jgi:hypothetical protein